MRKNVFSLKFRCMVHVKTSKEYELHQDLIVLFSETLMRAILEDLVTQDSVDFCDPSLMFAIPRLAIVYGLLICKKEGPLNVDRSSAEFPTLFLPFKNLLRKIRELLYTLEANEVRKAHTNIFPEIQSCRLDLQQMHNKSLSTLPFFRNC